MAHDHIARDKTNVYQAQITSILSRLLQTKYDLQNWVDAMQKMKEDGVVGTYLQTTCGYSSLDMAVAGTAEIEALNFKLNTDVQISFMSTAITQAADKFA